MEVWIQIKKFPDYDVSNMGKIRRRKDGSLVIQTLQKSHTRPYGYYYVGLRLDTNNWKTVPVHRLVCFAFNGKPSKNKPWACHLNGISTDNNPTNLVWASPLENARHRKSHRHYNEGLNNKNSKLSPKIGKEIKKYLDELPVKNGYFPRNSTTSIKEKYKVSHEVIKRIRNGTHWSLKC